MRGNRILFSGGIRPASVFVRDGRILRIGDKGANPSDCTVFDAGDSVVMPGLVDSHVHINEPGRTEWEGFDSATRAAAAGGVTALVDMPLNSIPATTSREALLEKIRAAEGRCWVDIGFWGGAVPGNTDHLRPLSAAGARGFKCFLISSGVEEFAPVSEEDLRSSLPVLAGMGATLLAHAELPGPIEQATRELRRRPGCDPRVYNTFLQSRPKQAENEAISLLIRLCREFRCPIHIVHLSSAEALPNLRDARKEGLSISVETCPHYLCLVAEEIPDGATEFKCCPPIRERKNCEQLWDGLREGIIDMIVSDHSPCPPQMKSRDTGDFLSAWGGISSLQFRLTLVWTEAQRRGFSLEQVSAWLAEAPARLAGLAGRKGSIREGYDADFVVWDPEENFSIEPERIFHRHKLTPYAGRQFRGTIRATFLRGQLVYDRGKFVEGPNGQLLV